MKGSNPDRATLLVVFWPACMLIAAACTFDLADVESVRKGDAGVIDGAADTSVTGGAGGSTGGTAGSGGTPWPEVDASEAGPEVGPNDTGAAGSAAGTGGTAGAGGTGGSAEISSTIRPSNSLDGDGFLAAPALCGDQVWDYYQQSTYKALHVGRDVPCSEVTTYRAYMRFGLESLAGATVQSAVLRFELRSKSTPEAGVDLLEINDFENLSASDWNESVLHDFGQVFGTSTALGWVEKDVTASVADAAASGSIAFKLQYRDESADPNGKSRWYGITAANEGTSRAPQLVVTYVP